MWHALQASRRRQSAAVFALYLAGSFTIWGLPLLPHFASTLPARLGTGYSTYADVRLYAWCLAWWPEAILHGWNPLHAQVLWAPQGVNMAWVTGLPGPSLAITPLTLAFGPVFSENALFVLAPALAGWATYLLARRITGAFLPSLVAGFLFGFSSYMSGQMLGHLNLVLVFPVPLCLYLILRRLDGSMGRLAFTVLLALTLIAQFSISTEVFAGMASFGAVALLGAIAFGPRRLRRPLFRTSGLVAVAYLVTAIVVSPLLIAAVASHPTGSLGAAPRVQVADLLNLALPRAFLLVGGKALSHVAQPLRNPNMIEEGGAYLGPLLLAVLLFVTTGWRRRQTWLLFGLFAMILVATLGPVLHVDGRPVMLLPWHLIGRLPGFDLMIPARFSLFLWLVVAVMMAIWLAKPGRWAAAKWFLVVLGAVAILPAARPQSPVATPRFFATGEFRRYLRPGETVLSIPVNTPESTTASFMAWQAETGFDFRLALGYVGGLAMPHIDQRSEVAEDLGWSSREPGRVSRAELWSFIVSHRVGVLLVLNPTVSIERFPLATLETNPRFIGGITVYGVRGAPRQARLALPDGAGGTRRRGRESSRPQ